MTEGEKTFGPSALATPANLLSLVRLIAGPVFAVVIVEVNHASWVLMTVWIILSVSDGADGWLARRHGTTRSGAFLDPLADKFLVLGALAALADRGVISWVGVILIAIREVAMSVYRTRAGKHGISVPARFSAKVKTVVQDLVVGFSLGPIIANGRTGFITVLLWAAVALSLGTGYSYYRDARQLHKESDHVAPEVAQRPTV